MKYLLWRCLKHTAAGINLEWSWYTIVNLTEVLKTNILEFLFPNSIKTFLKHFKVSLRRIIISFTNLSKYDCCWATQPLQALTIYSEIPIFQNLSEILTDRISLMNCFHGDFNDSFEPWRWRALVLVHNLEIACQPVEILLSPCKGWS